jgi:hypothetical protein
VQRDIAELFESTQTPAFEYREIEEHHRREGAIERWPLLRNIAQLLGQQRANVTPLASAARLFGEDGP